MDYAELGRRIRSMRRTRHMTQTDLARSAGISAPFLGHIERGSRIASLETLVQLCNALKTDANTLLAFDLKYLPENSLTELLQKALALATREK